MSSAGRPDLTAAQPAVLAHLGHPFRRWLLLTLSRRECTIDELAALEGAPSSVVADELAILAASRLVRARGAGNARPAAPEVCVLFLSTCNAARGQMAEAILRALGHGRIGAFSAASAPTAVHPLAVRVLADRGIDIAEQEAKHVALYRGMHFDYVITLCACKWEPCPAFGGEAEHHFWAVPDPIAANGPKEVRHAAFERVAGDLEGRARAFMRRLDARGWGRR